MSQPVLNGTGFTAIRVGIPNPANSSAPSQQGTPITYIERGTITVAPSAISANTSGDTSVVVANARLGDTVIATPPATALAAGLVAGQAWVATAGHISIRIGNITGGSLTPASGSWNYVLIRS
jgi:hypothetical protein